MGSTELLGTNTIYMIVGSTFPELEGGWVIFYFENILDVHPSIDTSSSANFVSQICLLRGHNYDCTFVKVQWNKIPNITKYYVGLHSTETWFKVPI